MLIRALTFILLYVSCFLISAQGTFNVRYNFADYNAGHENWDFCSVGQNIVVANQDGLLIFKNGIWESRTVSRKISPKALLTYKDNLYAGYGNDIGYYSIKNEVLDKKFNFIDLGKYAGSFNLVWKIIEQNGKIYFQTDKNIIVIQGNKILDVLNFSGFLRCIFPINNHIYFVDSKLGLLEDFKEKPYSKQFIGHEINVILPNSDSGIVIFDNTDMKMIVQYNERQQIFQEKWIDDYPFCGKIDSEGNIYIGTTENGIYVLNQQLKIVDHYNTVNVLKFNKVFNLFLTPRNILWVGMENGIERFQFDMPYTNVSYDNEFGNAIDAEEIGDKDYLLTSTGIYYCNKSDLFSLNTQHNLTRWNECKGPSYFIKEFAGKIYYGNLFGFQLYDNGTNELLSERSNCTDFRQLNQEAVIVKIKGEWKIYKLDKDKELKYYKDLLVPENIEVLEDKIIWHAGNKLHQIDFNYSLEFSKVKIWNFKQNIRGISLSNDTLLIMLKKETRFLKGTSGSKLLTEPYDKREVITIKNEKTILEKRFDIANMIIKSQGNKFGNMAYFISELVDFYNDKISFVKQLNDNCLVLGTYRGFIVVDAARLKKANDIKFRVKKICLISGGDKKEVSRISMEELFSDANEIIAEIEMQDFYYPQRPKFRLLGEVDGKVFYSAWTRESKVHMYNLPDGIADVTLECMDWMGNSKFYDLGTCEIVSEHKLRVILKYVVLIIVLFFLFQAIRMVVKKKVK